MKRVYSKEQSNYLLAKANYQVALDELAKLQEQHGLGTLVCKHKTGEVFYRNESLGLESPMVNMTCDRIIGGKS